MSVKSHLTSGASVRRESAATYSACKEGQKICGVFSETASFQSYGTSRIVRLLCSRPASRPFSPGGIRACASTTGVGSGVAPGARAPPCWIVLESFHKRETCFAGRIFRAWSGGPSLRGATARNRKGVAPRGNNNTAK